MIQKVNATDARIEEFKSWDGAAWFRSHLAWLKGSYHFAQLPPQKEETVVQKEKRKEVPYVNKDKEENAWKWLVSQYGKRQAKKLVRQYGY